MESKLIVQNLFHFLNQDEFLALRTISKSMKKFIKTIIRKNTHLHFRMRFAKNFTLLKKSTDQQELTKMKNDAKRFSQNTTSFVNLKNDHYVNYCFSEIENVLTFENHDYAELFPNYSLIELDVELRKNEDKEWIFDLTDTSNNSDLLEFLHDDERGGAHNICVDRYDVYDESFIVKFKKQFLEKDVSGDNWMYCKLFWWYKRFEEMPQNRTKFIYLEFLDDTNQEIDEKVKCKISKNYLWKNGEKYIHRSEWSEYGFDDIPLFITSSPDWE